MPLRSEIFAGTVRKWMIITVVAIDSNQWVRKNTREQHLKATKKNPLQKNQIPGLQFPREPPQQKPPKKNPPSCWGFGPIKSCEIVRDWKFGKLRNFPIDHTIDMGPSPQAGPKHATSPRFSFFWFIQQGEVWDTSRKKRLNMEEYGDFWRCHLFISTL